MCDWTSSRTKIFTDIYAGILQHITQWQTPTLFLPGALPCQTWFELCQRQRVPAHRSDRFSFRQAYSKLNPRQVGQDPLFGAGCLGTMTAGATNVHHSLSGVQLLSASNLATLAKVGDHDPAATAGVRSSHTGFGKHRNWLLIHNSWWELEWETTIHWIHWIIDHFFHVSLWSWGTRFLRVEINVPLPCYWRVPD